MQKSQRLYSSSRGPRVAFVIAARRTMARALVGPTMLVCVSVSRVGNAFLRKRCLQMLVLGRNLATQKAGGHAKKRRRGWLAAHCILVLLRNCVAPRMCDALPLACFCCTHWRQKKRFCSPLPFFNTSVSEASSPHSVHGIGASTQPVHTIFVWSLRCFTTVAPAIQGVSQT